MGVTQQDIAGVLAYLLAAQAITATAEAAMSVGTRARVATKTMTKSSPGAVASMTPRVPPRARDQENSSEVA